MQQVKPYTELAKIYAHLMCKIDYRDWADYLHEIILVLNINCDTTLELAAGNCNISGHLTKYFKKYFVSDMSYLMLTNSKKQDTMKICCDMIYLPFKTKFDLIFSAFDSVNYLLQFDQINSLFKNIRDVLKNNGYFTFDVSLEENSLLNINELNREGIFKGTRYKQTSIYDKTKKIHTNYFKIILDSDEEFLEIHKQRIYKFEDYFKYIEKNGMVVHQCYDAFTFNDANEKSERAQFIVKKISR